MVDLSTLLGLPANRLERKFIRNYMDWRRIRSYRWRNPIRLKPFNDYEVALIAVRLALRKNPELLG